jgi:immunity protein 27 of polymorphic toxin system
MSENPENRDRLEGNEGQEFARRNLVQVVVDDVNWKVSHRNPVTGEYWKEFFPQSKMHGGGPPVFVKISEEEATREFKFELK